MSLLRHRTSEAKTNLLRLSGSDTIQQILQPKALLFIQSGTV